jgi:hypothetical protein
MIQVGQENICIRGLLDGHGGDHAAGTHGAQDGQDFPPATGRCFVDVRASRTTRIEPRHRCGDAAFIQENQLFERSRVDFLKELSV